MPVRVLCLDIEGGYGGSSRSLYESLCHMDREAVSAEVWCGREGPIQARYDALGIPCRVIGPLPRYSALPRASRNLLALARLLPAMRGARLRLGELESAVQRFDVIHYNHESLCLVAARLRRRSRVRQVMHLRTNVSTSLFARWQARTIAGAVDHAVFITENERDSWQGLGLTAPAGSVIYNIAGAPKASLSPHSAIPDDGRFRVACISNYTWTRGVDRLVDVAVALRKRGRRDVVFVHAGDIRLRGKLPGNLGNLVRRGATLADYAAARGVADAFMFLGHVAEPERVLRGCHITARPSREDNPWGREALESLAAGLPVVATGSYDRFVEDGVTGYLLPTYDVNAFADVILRLADDMGGRNRLGIAAQARIAELCDGETRAADLLAIWQGVG